jgi:hypothetical protein
MLLNDLPDDVRNRLETPVLIEMLTGGVNATVEAYFLSYARVTGNTADCSSLWDELYVKRCTVRTPDGYTFYRLPDGTWVDSLDPDCVDMRFASDADVAESWYDDSVRALDLLIEIRDTRSALDFQNNAPDCEPGQEAEYAWELRAELKSLYHALSEVR